NEFLARASREAGRREVTLTPDAVALLEQHTWPGNVRELRNVIERAIVLCSGKEINAAQLAWLVDRPSRPAPPRSAPPLPSSAPPPPETRKASLRDEMADAERARILETLERVGGNQSKAAEMLGMSRRTLLRRLDEYAVPRPRKG